MRPSIPARKIPITIFLLLCGASAIAQQQGDAQRYELHGRVVNAASGEPVGGALVTMFSSEEKAVFSGAGGEFAFTNLPRGQYTVTARKPGYFGVSELGYWQAAQKASTAMVPQENEFTVKLTAEGVIYGEVKDEAGEPIEGLSVKAQSWMVVEGRRQLNPVGQVNTDDEGRFRIAELRPGEYFLAFVPTSGGGWRQFSGATRRKQSEHGYGMQFYPGVYDAASAGAIRVRAGAQIHVTQTLGEERLYDVAGVVRGFDAEAGFGIMLMNSSGDMVQREVRVEPKTGEFQISGVPPGRYLLTAMAMRRRGESPNEAQQTATLPVQVNGDVTGLALMLGLGASVSVRLNDEIGAENSAEQPHQVVVRMFSKDFPQVSRDMLVPPPKEERRAGRGFGGMMPGVYTVQAQANGMGYVAALRCGSLDLLREDLTLGLGATLPPIEVTLRNDGAQLAITAVKNGQSVAASVVVYSEDYPKRSFQGMTYDGGAMSWGNLAPGTYRIVAVGEGQQLEFRNPAAMEKFLGKATTVNLSPGDKANVRAEVQEMPEPGEEQP